MISLLISSHAEAYEVAAGAAGFLVDRIFETKGLDAIDGLERVSW